MNKAVFLFGSVFFLLGAFLFFYTVTETWHERVIVGYAYYVDGVFYGYERPTAQYLKEKFLEKYGTSVQLDPSWSVKVTNEPVYDYIEHSLSYMPYRLYGAIFLIVGSAVFLISFFIPSKHA